MPLTRFEECWPLPTESLPKLPLNLNTVTLTLTLWPINSGLTSPTPLIIPHRIPAFLESLMPLKNWCSIHARCSKSSLKHSIRFCGIFPSLKQNFIVYRSSKVSDCNFEIHQLWQSSFSRVYSNSWCSCSLEPEMIKSVCHLKMYSDSILNFQESTTILNAPYEKSLETYWRHLVHSKRIHIKKIKETEDILLDEQESRRSRKVSWALKSSFWDRAPCHRGK